MKRTRNVEKVEWYYLVSIGTHDNIFHETGWGSREVDPGMESRGPVLPGKQAGRRFQSGGVTGLIMTRPEWPVLLLRKDNDSGVWDQGSAGKSGKRVQMPPPPVGGW